MKRRTKKILINQPTDLDDIELYDIDDGGSGWDTDVSGARGHKSKGLKKTHHLSGMQIRHFNKHSKGRGIFH
jgi:hypothetical protein